MSECLGVWLKMFFLLLGVPLNTAQGAADILWVCVCVMFLTGEHDQPLRHFDKVLEKPDFRGGPGSLCGPLSGQ